MLVLMCGARLHATDYKSKIYQCFIDDKMDDWKGIIDKMNLQPDKSADFLKELINYQIGYIGWCLSVEKDSQAKKYIEITNQNIALLEPTETHSDYVDVYKASIYGFKIGLNPLGAPYYGPKSVSHSRNCMKIAPANPYGYILYGNAQYYLWAFFGGSKSTAISYYKKAEKLMESISEETSQNWNYLSLLTMIAHAYEEMDQIQKAKIYYEKILYKEPNYRWVKNELYPEILKQIALNKK